MATLLKGLKYDNNTSQNLTDGDPGFLTMNDYGHLKVEQTNPAVYTSQSDSYSSGSSKVGLISAVRNDSSSNVLCSTNNNICPLSCDSSGALFCYIKGQSSGNVSQIDGNTVAINSGNLSNGVQRIAIATDDINLSNMNSKITTMQSDIASMKSDISSMKTNFDSLMTIMNDIYISGTHRIRTLAQAL